MKAFALLLLMLFSFSFFSLAQTNTPCTADVSEPQTEEERERRARFAAYRLKLTEYQARLPAEADAELFMPVEGVRVADISDTWGAPRGSGRVHEGQDIFAPRGTPVYSATEGFVYRKGTGNLGGRVVWIAGAGGRRYYYAHLDDWAAIEEGQFVDTSTVIGYVGNTGNAVTTPPHLHFGVYSGSRSSCDRRVYDPLPLLVDRAY